MTAGIQAGANGTRAAAPAGQGVTGLRRFVKRAAAGPAAAAAGTTAAPGTPGTPGAPDIVQIAHGAPGGRAAAEENDGRERCEMCR
ncbi:MAG: hypothetical protein ACRDPY_36710, partial [Streptosporangiaceae bacterium]